MNSPLALIAAAALALAGGVAAAPDAGHGDGADAKGAPAKAQRSCFDPRFIDGFAAPDDRNLYIRVGVRDVYHFEMFSPCLDMDWNWRLGVVARPGPFICDGMDAEVISHAVGLGRQRCLVRNMKKLSPEEVAALPKRAKP
jgi:hypothetical protein